MYNATVFHPDSTFTTTVAGDNGNPNRDKANIPLQVGVPDDDLDCAIMAYGTPSLDGLTFGITPPNITAPQFELKHVMFQMLQTVGQFNGMSTEDPIFICEHLWKSVMISSFQES